MSNEEYLNKFFTREELDNLTASAIRYSSYNITQGHKLTVETYLDKIKAIMVMFLRECDT